jgi:hypothetical protein
MDYETYIKSPAWEMKAEDAKRRSGYSCALCTRTTARALSGN